MRFIGTWAVLVAVLFARRGWDEVPSGNEMTKLSFAQQTASPGWAKGDFAFEGQEPLYHHVYVKTSIVISRWKSVAWYAAAHRIVNVLLFCAGFLALGRAIGLTDAGSIIAFVVYCGVFSLRHVLSWADYLQLGATGLVRVWADPDETAWGLALLGVRGRCPLALVACGSPCRACYDGARAGRLAARRPANGVRDLQGGARPEAGKPRTAARRRRAGAGLTWPGGAVRFGARPPVLGGRLTRLL